MSPAKLIALVILGALAWQHQAMLREKAEVAQHFFPTFQTYMKMRTYKPDLVDHLKESGNRFPRDISAWLDQRFGAHGKGPASVDYFGTPYEAGYQGRQRIPELRSCGPDRQCHTEDDLVMVMDGS